MPLTIALTGGIACGKSTVAAMLRDLGAAIVDADAISRSHTAAGGKALPHLREAFGDGIFEPDGTLNRAALSAIVFSDEHKRAQLNAITHPLIRRQMEEEAECCRKSGAPLVVLDVPLLFEAGMQHMAQLVACVSCPEEVQIDRMRTRNGYTREEALGRIRSQWPLEKKLALSDVVIDTDMPLPELAAQVERLYRSWTQA